MMLKKFSCALAADDAEKIGEKLLEAGALSITYVDADPQHQAPILEPLPETHTLWQKSGLSAVCEASDPQEARLHTALQLEGLLQERDYQVTETQESDCVIAEELDPTPMQFGTRLWVLPSRNATPPNGPDAVCITLPPGLAFGTGLHPSTRLCLEWLDTVAQQQTFSERALIDFGCGSGILGIAAAKLGVRQVTAIDHDWQALEATEKNAKLNGVWERIATQDTQNSDSLSHLQADLLIANILAEPIIALAPTFKKMVRPGGRLALSGILTTQSAGVRRQYEPFFTLTEWKIQEDWVCLVGLARQPEQESAWNRHDPIQRFFRPGTSVDLSHCAASRRFPRSGPSKK